MRVIITSMMIVFMPALIFWSDVIKHLHQSRSDNYKSGMTGPKDVAQVIYHFFTEPGLAYFEATKVDH